MIVVDTVFVFFLKLDWR